MNFTADQAPVVVPDRCAGIKDRPGPLAQGAETPGIPFDGPAMEGFDERFALILGDGRFSGRTNAAQKAGCFREEVIHCYLAEMKVGAEERKDPKSEDPKGISGKSQLM